MHLHLRLQYLSLALFSPSILALTIPQGTTTITPATLTNSSHTDSSLNATSNSGVITCSKRTAQTRVEPRFADCAGALRLLPLNPSVGIFYSGPGRGDFQLPYFHSYRTCMVVLTMQSALDRVQSSWLAVQVAAMELNEACQDVRTAPGLGSASTFVDDLGAMRITLTTPQSELGVGGDGVIETS